VQPEVELLYVNNNISQDSTGKITLVQMTKKQIWPEKIQLTIDLGTRMSFQNWWQLSIHCFQLHFVYP